MKIKLALALCCVLLLLGLCFRHTVAIAVIDWQLKSFAHKHLGADFSYTDLKREGHRYVIVEPRIHEKRSGIQAWTLHAERVYLTFDLALWKRSLSVDLDVIDAQARLRQLGEQRVLLPLLRGHRDGWLKLAWTLRTRAGELQVLGPDDVPAFKPVNFSLELAEAKSLQGELELSFDDRWSNVSTLGFDWDVDAGKGELIWDARHAEALPLATVAKLLTPVLADWRVSNGHLSGSGCVRWDPVEGLSAEADSQLRVEHLVCDSSDQGIALQLPNLDCVFHAKREPMGSLHITRGATLNLLKEGRVHTTLHEVKGRIDLSARAVAGVDIQALYHQGLAPRSLALTGTVDPLDPWGSVLDLRALLHSDTSSDVLIAVRASKSAQLPSWRVKVEHLGASEWGLFTHFLSGRWEQLEHCHVRDGSLDLRMKVTQAPDGDLAYHCDSLFIHQLELELPQLEGHLRAGALTGQFDYSQANALSCQLNLADGHLHSNLSSTAPFHLSDVNAELNFREGECLASSLRLRSGDLQGSLDITPGEERTFVAKLEGSARGLVPLIPAQYGKAYQRTLAEQQLDLSVVGDAWGDSLSKLTGHAQLQSWDGKRQERVQFGCVLGRRVPQKASLLGISSPYACGLALMDSFGMRLTDGWFQAENLDAATVLSPALFPEGAEQLRGRVACQGSFEQGHLITRYNVEDLELETDAFFVELARSGPMQGDAAAKDYLAVHHFDLGQLTHYGHLPLNGARFRLKKQGVLFENCRGKLNIEPNELFFNELAVQVDDLSLKGKLRLDRTLEGPSDYRLEIQTQAIDGSYATTARFVEKLLGHPLGPIPFAGRIRSQEPSQIRLAFHGDEVDMEARIQGRLEEGAWQPELEGVLSRDISAHFTYDHRRRELEVTQLNGQVLLGQGVQQEEYTLRAPHLRIYGFPAAQADFDLRVEGRTRDLIRLVGNSAYAPEHGEGAVSLAFDPKLTHLGSIRPHISRLSIRDWSDLLELKAAPSADLLGLLGDLEHLAAAGILPLSADTVRQLHDYSISGDVLADIEFPPNAGYTRFELRGDGIVLQDYPLTSFQLTGRSYGDRWVVDAFDCADLNIAAEWHPTDKGAQIDFVGLRYGDFVLSGMEAFYDARTQSFEGFVNVMDVNLKHAHQLPGFPAFLADANFEGMLRAQGKLSGELRPSWPFIDLRAELKADMEDLTLYDLPLKPLKNVHCDLDFERGVSFKSIQLGIDDQSLGLRPMGFLLDEVSYGFHRRNVVLDGLQFRIPASNLDWMAEFISQRVPDVLPEERLSLVKDVLADGVLAGALHLETAPSYRSWRLELPEGIYFYEGEAHHLRKLCIEQEPTLLHAHAEYLYRDHIYTLRTESDFPSLSRGSVWVSDVEQSQGSPLGSEALELKWERPHAGGFVVRSIIGGITGLSCNLHHMPVENSRDIIQLGGEVEMDFRSVSKLLPEAFGSTIARFQMGQGYSWDGKLQYDRKKQTLLSCEGLLGGHDFEAMGFRLKSLFAHVDYHGDRLELRNVRVSDVSGEATMDSLYGRKNPLDEWECSIPLVSLHDFRPSLLTTASGQQGKLRPLVVNRMELLGIKGIIGEADSFTGKGSMSFVNPSKAHIQNSILAIPSDILARIGLDLDLLTPVVGTVYYEMRDGRVYLTNFQDMYSEGRVSRFFLADREGPSYVDLEGNLNVKVRMKQYNLIFKLAELFTLSVRGQLQHPTYSLQRQGDDIVDSSWDRPDAA